MILISKENINYSRRMGSCYLERRTVKVLPTKDNIHQNRNEMESRCKAPVLQCEVTSLASMAIPRLLCLELLLQTVSSLLLSPCPHLVTVSQGEVWEGHGKVARQIVCAMSQVGRVCFPPLQDSYGPCSLLSLPPWTLALQASGRYGTLQ